LADRRPGPAAAILPCSFGSGDTSQDAVNDLVDREARGDLERRARSKERFDFLLVAQGLSEASSPKMTSRM
jgi:hypothetical protein